MNALRLIAASIAVSSLAWGCSPAAPEGAAPGPVASAAVTPVSIPAASPRAFVEDLYGQYRKDENFSPFTHPGKWFDPELLAAIKENDALTPEGEVGAIDGDPLCSCQDASGMLARVAGIEQKTPTTATARIDLWPDTPDQRGLELALVLVNGQWRVHDAIEMGEAEGNHSFLTYVREANAAARAGKR